MLDKMSEPNKEIKKSWIRPENFATNFEISEFCCLVFLEATHIQSFLY